MIISAFIIPRMMVTYYGSEVNGLVSSITQFVAYLALIEGGLSAVTTFSLFKPIANRNIEIINRILIASRNFYYKIGFYFLAVIFVGAFFYPFIVKSSSFSYYDVFFLVLIIGSNSILEFFTLAKYRALLTADQKTYIISIATIVQVIVFTFIVVFLSTFQINVVIIRLFALISIFIRSLILICYCKSSYKFIDFNGKPLYEALDQRWSALYLQILGMINTGAPIIIITLMLDLNSVSIYTVYYLVINGINTTLSIFTGSVSSGFGDLIAVGNQKSFRKAFSHFHYVYMMILPIVYSVTSVMYIPFISLYMKDADINYIFPTLAYLMAINGFLYNIKTPQGMLVIAAGKYKETRLQTTSQALIIIIIGPILTLYHGINGLMIAMILSNLYRIIDLLIYTSKFIVHKYLKVAVFKTVISILSYLGSIIAIYLVMDLASNSFLEWISKAIIALLITTLITFIFNFLSNFSEMKEIYFRIKQIFTRKTGEQ